MAAQLQVFKNDIFEINNPYKKIGSIDTNLSLMEMPYDFSNNLKKEIYNALFEIEINRYPDPECGELKSAVRNFFKIRDHEITFSNGLMELIQNICFAFSSSGEHVIISSPSFFMFKRFIRQSHMIPIEVPLQDDFNLDVNTFINAIDQYKPKIIFIDYPNNPTGKLFKREDILKILDHATGVVVIDEAYFSYSGSSFIDDLKDYENLIVLRTMSKLGLASLRLGFMVTSKKIANYLEKVMPPFRVNSFTQVLVTCIIRNNEIIKNNLDKVLSTRKILLDGLLKIKRYQSFYSSANFILFKTDHDSSLLYDHLTERNILINSLHGTNFLLKNCLRVAVGTPNQVLAFLNEVNRFLEKTDHKV